MFSPLPGCFEHFGLDFLVDEDFHVWFLEANPGPDFKQVGLVGCGFRFSPQLLLQTFAQLQVSLDGGFSP